MGWTCYHRPRGTSNLDWLRSEIGKPDFGTILDAATVGGTIYAAWRLGPAHGDDNGRIVGLVVLTRWDSRSEYNFCHKDMTETMGPCEDRCPARILDLLDPTTDEYALEWRQRCRDRLAKRADAAKVRPGQVVRFARPLEFANGENLDTFTFQKGSTFRGTYGGLYRIRNWRERTYEVVSAA